MFQISRRLSFESFKKKRLTRICCLENQRKKQQFCQTFVMPSLSIQLHTRSDLTIVLTGQVFWPATYSDQRSTKAANTKEVLMYFVSLPQNIAIRIKKKFWTDYHSSQFTRKTPEILLILL
jgi:hypothetical protein